MKLRNLSIILLTVLLIGLLPAASLAAVEDPYNKIAATSYDDTNAPDKFPKKEDCVWMQARTHGSYLCFKDVNFTDAPYAVSVSTATEEAYLAGNTYEFKLDSPNGPLISTVYVTECDDFTKPVENVGTITKSITGVHDIYVSTNQPNNLHNFYFLANKKGERIYRPYSEGSVFSDTKGYKYEDDIRNLYSLGIIDEYEDDTFMPLIPVTRAVFAKWLCNLLTDTVPENAQDIFSDVKKDDNGYNETAYLYENGILTLNSEKTFNPWAFIKARDAAAMILRLLGYERMCEYKGGYPSGYDNMARTVGLLKNTAPNDYLRRGTAANMLYAAINAEYLQASGIENNDIIYDKKIGILESTRNIKIGSGIVTATSYSSISGGADIADGTCYIGTERFYTDSVNVENYLGVKCEYFYKADKKRNVNTLISIFPNSHTKQEFLESKGGIEFSKIDSDMISYTDKNKKKKNIKIPTTAIWIYNNRAIQKPISSIVSPSDFKGSLRLVDNGGGYEVIFVEQYINIKIQSFDNVNKILTDELTGSEFDFSDSDWLLSDGKNSVDIRKIARGQLAELYLSDDKKMGALLFGESEVTGIAEEIKSDGTLKINGQEYYTASEFETNKIVLGKAFRFHLNRHNEIVYVDSADKTKMVGVFADLKKSDDKPVFSIVTATNKITDFEATNKVFVDGIRMEDYDEIRNGKGIHGGLVSVKRYTPVLYSVDEEGKIFMIDTIADGAKDDNDTLTALNSIDDGNIYTYKNTVGVFVASGSFNLSFPVKKDADTIFVGKYNESALNCYLGKLNKYSSNEKIPFVFYSSKRDAKIADIVYNPEYTQYSQHKDLFVDSISVAVNDNGIVGTNINVLESGTIKSYWISPENTTYTNYAAALKKGDIIEFYTDMSNEITSFKIICFADGSDKNSVGMMATVSQLNGVSGYADLSVNYLYGTIKSFDEDFVEISAYGEGESFWCRTSTLPHIYRIDSEGAISESNTNTLKPGDVILISIVYSPKWAAVFE